MTIISHLIEWQDVDIPGSYGIQIVSMSTERTYDDRPLDLP